MDCPQEQNNFPLPKEMIETIFSFLGSPDLKNCRLVCKWWKTMIDSSSETHQRFTFRGLDAIFGTRYVSPFERMTTFALDRREWYRREISVFRNYIDNYDRSVSEIFLANVDIRFERVIWGLALESNPRSEELFIRFVQERTLRVREIILELGCYSKPFGQGLEGYLDGLKTLKVIQSRTEYMQKQYLSDFLSVTPEVATLSLLLRGVCEVDLGLSLEGFAAKGKLKHLLLQGNCLCVPVVSIPSLVELTVFNYNFVYGISDFLNANPQIERIHFAYKFRVFGHRIENLGALMKDYRGTLRLLHLKGTYSKIRAEFYRVLAFRGKFERLVLEVGLDDEPGRVIVDRPGSSLHGGSILGSCLLPGLTGRRL